MKERGGGRRKRERERERERERGEGEVKGRSGKQEWETGGRDKEIGH